MKKLNKLPIALLMVFSIQALAQDKDDFHSAEVIPDHLAYLYAPNRVIDESALRQIYGNERRWENGRKLRVCFYNGNPVVTKLVRTIASEWNENSGVIFDFGVQGSWINCMDPKAGFPEIRVGFAERGYWSYVGSDSERHGGERAPSMNFDSFNRIYNEFRYSVDDVVSRADSYHKSTIRHEFGHALALLHEHQNTNLNCYSEIRWTGPNNVYESFGGSPNFWTKEQVDRNLGLIGATDPDNVAKEPDLKSIMMYSLPEKIFRQGAASKCAIPKNYEISSKDRSIISEIYPKLGNDGMKPVVSEAITAAYVKPAPLFLADVETVEYMDRAVADLESDDTATRRNARTRLSLLLAQDVSSNALEKLIEALPSSSYRYQLGLAVAIANANGQVEASKNALRILRNQASSTKDSTLKHNLKNAQNNLDQK